MVKPSASPSPWSSAMTESARGAPLTGISERCSRNAPPSAHSNVARPPTRGASDASIVHSPTSGSSADSCVITAKANRSERSHPREDRGDAEHDRCRVAKEAARRAHVGEPQAGGERREARGRHGGNHGYRLPRVAFERRAGNYQGAS